MQRITSSFGFHSTALDVVRGVDLEGRRAIVTGGAGGIGLETCRALAAAGAEVTIAVRNPVKAERSKHELEQSQLRGRVLVDELDIADRPSVEKFAAKWSNPLDILIANAGIMMVPDLRRTREGWELQFATNFLGHFALSLGLFEALAAAGAARIVMVSSSGHLFSPVIFDDPDFRFVPYDPLLAYAQSKTACILFGVEASRRWRGAGIGVNSVMPGAVATNLQQYTGGLRTPVERRKTAAQGAATSVWAATAPELRGIGGRYFEDVSEAEIVGERGELLNGVASYALDEENGARLWALSVAMLHSARGEEPAHV